MALYEGLRGTGRGKWSLPKLHFSKASCPLAVKAPKDRAQASDSSLQMV